MKLTDAQIAELRSLTHQDGRLEPRQVLEHARNPKSSLHTLFEWDDAEAANLYRLQQAREAIRTLRVVMTVETVELKVPEYIRDPDASAASATYRHVAHIKTDSNRARDSLVAELQRLRAQATRVKALAHLLGGPADAQWVQDTIDASEIAVGRALEENRPGHMQ